MQYYVRPVQLDCTQCGTTGVPPRVRKIDERHQIREEAVWSCPTCGYYIRRGTVSIEEKKQEDK